MTLGKYQDHAVEPYNRPRELRKKVQEQHKVQTKVRKKNKFSRNFQKFLFQNCDGDDIFDQNALKTHSETKFRILPKIQFSGYVFSFLKMPLSGGTYSTFDVLNSGNSNSSHIFDFIKILLREKFGKNKLEIFEIFNQILLI